MVVINGEEPMEGDTLQSADQGSESLRKNSFSHCTSAALSRQMIRHCMSHAAVSHGVTWCL